MSSSSILGGGYVDPVFFGPVDDRTAPRRRGGHVSAFQRGRGPGSTAVGPRKGEEKSLPPKRTLGSYLELG